MSVTIITPVYNPDPGHLRACIESVRRQTSTDWQHVLVDDCSTDPLVGEVLDELVDEPSFIVLRRAEQGGIAAATSDGLAAAPGDVVAFLDHDDVLETDAIDLMATAIDGGADVAYSDHDFIRYDGRYVDPCYKPDFSPERLRSQNYITHFVVARRTAIDAAGGLRLGLDGAQDHDLMLRLGEVSAKIEHVPRILYHWRQTSTSVTGGTDAKPWAFEAGVRAVADHCDRIGLDAEVSMTEHEGIYRVDRHVDDPLPLVSVIVPTRGSSGRVWGMTRCFVYEAIRSITEHSSYPNLEFVVVADDDMPSSVGWALADLLGDRLTTVTFRDDFNFSAKINAGVAAASGDLLLLLNDDTELIEPNSIEELVSIVRGPAEGRDGAHGGVAMAGAKLLFGDGTLQHGGHVYNAELMHACLGWSGDAAGPFPMRPLAVAREASGVTAAAALVRRDAFEAVGGFTTELPLNYNDVDFSLKIRADGHRIVWTPHAAWYHFESRTRASVLLPEEYKFIEHRWLHEIHHDPYYNLNLEPCRSDWMPRPFRSGAPPVETRPNLLRRLSDRSSARPHSDTMTE